MLTDCNSLATVCASKTGPKPSPLDPMQPVMERSHPTSGRSATPADINRSGRPTSIGTSGRHQSECPADIIGMRSSQRDERVHHVVVLLRQLRAARRAKAAGHRNMRMLGDPERVEAVLFQRHRQCGRLHRIVGKENSRADLHIRSSADVVQLGFYSAASRAGELSARSTRGLTSVIISSIERIAALCGVAPTLNEKHIWTGWVARISPTNFSATVSTSPIKRSL